VELQMRGKLALPQTAPGLYMVQVYKDGKMVLNQKLTIQQ
jgi:hypothetical protein